MTVNRIAVACPPRPAGQCPPHARRRALVRRHGWLARAWLAWPGVMTALPGNGAGLCACAWLDRGGLDVAEDWRWMACAALRGYGVRGAGAYVKAPAGLMAGVLELCYSVRAWPMVPAVALVGVAGQHGHCQRQRYQYIHCSFPPVDPAKSSGHYSRLFPSFLAFLSCRYRCRQPVQNALL